MRTAMTARAWMFFRLRMHAAGQFRCLVGVAALAIDLRDVIRVRVFLDICVAVVALKAAMDAGAEFVPIYGDAVPGRILHRLVAVAGQALRLCYAPHWPKEKHHRDEGHTRRPVKPDDPDEMCQPFDWADENCDKKRSDTRGSGHALVFLHVA